MLKLPMNNFAFLAIVVTCVILLLLAGVGILSWTSPVEIAAEAVLKAETGVDVKPPSK